MEEGGAGSKLEGGLTSVDWEVEGERLGVNAGQTWGVSLKWGEGEWAVEWAKREMGLGVLLDQTWIGRFGLFCGLKNKQGSGWLW